MKQVFNPYLPAGEYIPDGEPHVFGNRVYVYGSHDRFNAAIFCVNDYVCYSAPVDDLSAWRYEGVIYKKKQDPLNKLGIRLLFAPDVVQGVDGRYYLYYAYDFLGRMGVAVSDKPQGPYEYYGHVRYADGREWGSRSGDEFPFDPGALVDDDGRVYLYSGFATKVPFIMSRFHNLRNSGGVGMELEQDMLTIKDKMQLIFPQRDNNPPKDFMGHAFFEASSIRKIDGKYVFVYSSENNHELCYAVSEHPLSGYRYGGTLVDLGDLYMEDGTSDETRGTNYLGNTHGGMAELNGQWYIFYHRQTNQHSYSRQACAEPLKRTPDGGFQQAEVTSCGLNGVYFPMAQGTDGIKYHLSVLAAANFQALLAAQDGIPYKTASNTDCGIIENLYMGEDNAGRVYDDALINEALCKNGIASAAYVGGRWCIWGCHSADYDQESGDQINVSETNRMMLYYISNDFQHRRTLDVDKPLTANDIASIVAEEQTRLDALTKIGALTYGEAHLNADADAKSDIMNGDYSFTFNVTTTPLAKSLTAIVNWTEDGFTTYFENFGD